MSNAVQPWSGRAGQQDNYPVGTNGAFLKDGKLLFGLVIAVDIEGFSGFRVIEQPAAQVSLTRVLTYAAEEAGLDRTDWFRQPRGDGELAVLPAATDPAWVVAQFSHHLDHALRQLSSSPGSGPPLRVRMAMHHGPLTAGQLGPVGTAPVVACRLLDARSTKKALTGDPLARLALVISRQLYLDVVTSGFHGLATERFRPIRATVKGVTYPGNLCLGTPKRVTRDHAGL